MPILRIFVTFVAVSVTPYVFPKRIVFFHLMTTGRTFDIRLCENSINQSNTTPCSFSYPALFSPLHRSSNQGMSFVINYLCALILTLLQ